MLKKFLLIIINFIFLLNLTGCATPATQTIALSDEELRREEAIQREIIAKYPPKQLKKPKHADLSIYQNRLNKVAKPLTVAAKKLCKKNDCNYALKIAKQDVLNAWADGKSINFTPIMMDFLDSDKELAIVAAHELAHNVMQHIDKKMNNAVIGSIFDILAAAGGVNTQGAFGSAGVNSYSQDFENEADYIGLYIMAIAGYDISNVNFLWRKMSVEMPNNIQSSFFSTHPSNAARFLRMQKTINEINAKKRAHQALLPNLKK